MTYEEISEPYIIQFGEPDNVFEISLEGKNYKQLFWYQPDVIVEFFCTKENSKKGWELSFALSLDPLKYYRKPPQKK
jgi:hypothetical protein